MKPSRPNVPESGPQAASSTPVTLPGRQSPPEPRRGASLLAPLLHLWSRIRHAGGAAGGRGQALAAKAVQTLSRAAASAQASVSHVTMQTWQRTAPGAAALQRRFGSQAVLLQNRAADRAEKILQAASHALSAAWQRIQPGALRLEQQTRALATEARRVPSQKAAQAWRGSGQAIARLGTDIKRMWGKNGRGS